VAQPTPEEQARIAELVTDFCRVMACDPAEVLARPFTKFFPYTSRPYGKMYAY
jgi:hypothetical protein